MKKYTVIIALLWLCGLSGAPAQKAAPTSTSSGVFTAEQAKSGERQYQSKCASCHGDDLHSTDPEAPDLTEGAFKRAWVGQTIAKQLQNIRSTMPQGQPRSLEDQVYLDILAYILQFNGVPTGNRKLGP